MDTANYMYNFFVIRSFFMMIACRYIIYCFVNLKKYAIPVVVTATSYTIITPEVLVNFTMSPLVLQSSL